MQREIKIGMIAGVVLLAVLIVFWSQSGQGAVGVGLDPEADRYDFADAQIGGADGGVSDGAMPIGVVVPSRGNVTETLVGQGDRSAPARPERPVQADRTHVCRAGETLWGLAKQYYGTGARWKDIAKANRAVLPKSNQLKPGMKLRIPGAGGVAPPVAPVRTLVRASSTPRRAAEGRSRTHVVAAGESLSTIAKRYYGSARRWKALLRANRSVISSPTRLRVGTTLVIPPMS